MIDQERERERERERETERQRESEREKTIMNNKHELEEIATRSYKGRRINILI